MNCRHGMWHELVVQDGVAYRSRTKSLEESEVKILSSLRCACLFVAPYMGEPGLVT